jgi:putative protease
MREVSQVINGKRVIVKKPELLAPAGNLEKLKVAILYGADAVFIVKSFLCVQVLLIFL